MRDRPDEIPCPNCKASLWHSFLGLSGDDLTPDPVPDPIKVIWTDGFFVDLGGIEDKDGPVFPEHGEFIGKCPKCSSLFPDHFIPWSEMDKLGWPNSQFVLSSPSTEEPDLENELTLANLDETLRYVDHLARHGLVSTWEGWTGIQQVIFLSNKWARDHGELSKELEKRVRSTMQLMVSALSGAMEGAFAPRTLLTQDSDRLSESLPNDWATFSDMYRIAGDFEHAEQYLNYASRALDDFEESESAAYHSYLFSQQIIRRQRARIELLGKLSLEASNAIATSSEMFTERPHEQTKQVFTFYINDQDAEIGVYGQVASNEEEVEKKLREKGFVDFFLFEKRDLGPEESEDAANFRIKLSPHLGPKWIPVVNAIQLVLEDRRSSFFKIQTLARKSDFDPHRSPYIQGMVLEDGRFHLEAPKSQWELGHLSESKVQQLQFIGWNLPGDTDATYNFWRAFDYGWNARSVAEFTLETLTSVFEITDEDFFDFGSVWQPSAIWERRELYRVPIAETNPNGSIFRIPDEADYRVDSFEDVKRASSASEISFEIANPYPDSQETRIANFVDALKEMRATLESFHIHQSLEKLNEVIGTLDYQGHGSALKFASGVLDALNRVPNSSMSQETAKEFEDVRARLAQSIEAFPFPVGKDKSVSFDNLPQGLQDLISAMVQRVLGNHPEDGQRLAATLIEFCNGDTHLLESEIQTEMSGLLRILTDDADK